MICRNYNKMIIIFQIISSLLKYYNNEKEFVIMRFVFNFNENFFL